MIYFSDFDAAAGGGTDVVIAVQDFAVPTNTGSANNFTTAAFGGETPKAALIVSSNYDPAAGAGHSANGQIAVGTLANNAYAMATVTRGAFDTRRRWYEAQAFVVQREDSTSARWRASGAFIADGIALTGVSTSSTTSRVAAFVGFAGADVTADNGTIDLGTGTSAISVSCGFRPDFVFLFGSGLSPSASAGTDYVYTFGIATRDGTQRTVINAMASIGTPKQALLTNRGGGGITASTGALAYDLTIGGFTTSGFEVTPSASAGGADIGYLALKIGGKRAKIVSLTTPTSTGSQVITGAGFTPQFAIVILTNLDATDPTFSLTSDDTMAGISVNLIGDEQWATSAFADSGSVTSGSQRANVALIGPSSSDGNAISATLTSFDSDGMTLNYSAVQGTGKKGFILFIE